MKPTIFNYSDFQLCSVPVPDGYPQSQTHAGIAHNNGKYYLTTSPYPVPKYSKWEGRIRRILNILSFGWIYPSRSGEFYENPCLYIGECNGDKKPTQFRLMQKTALMSTPESYYGLPSYNSDPDIFIENDIIYILNRSVIRTRVFNDKRPYEYDTRLYLIEGIDENAHFKLLSNQLVCEGAENIVSPCLTQMKGQYLFAFLDNRLLSGQVVLDHLYLSMGDDMRHAIQAGNRRSIEVKSNEFIPWHMSLFTHNNVLYSVVTCTRNGAKDIRMWQMLGRFNEQLTELIIFPTPLTDYNSYRGSALVTEDGIFVLYTTVVNERIQGASSVDGRDVLVASLPFEYLLERIAQ